MNKVEKNRKVKPRVIIISFGIFISLLLVLAGASSYSLSRDNGIVEVINRIIPFPIVVIDNKDFITINELNNNTKSVRKFYENQDFSKFGIRIDFSTEEGIKRLQLKERAVLNKMIEDRAIELLANDRGIEIQPKLIEQAIERKTTEYGTSESLKESMQRLYGWSMDDFKEKIVRPSMFKDELEKIFEREDTSKIRSREKIERAFLQLNSGSSFTEVAKECSEGASAKNGGEMGWFKAEMLMSEIAKEAFSLKDGERSGVIESQLGFHVIMIDDVKEEDGEKLVKISQIFVAKRTFSDWLKNEMGKLRVVVLSRDYVWNNEEMVVEFKNNDMRDFEKKFREELSGDASFVY